MSIAISHNMDNINQIAQTDLEKYMGLDATGVDASGSKKMTVTNGNITYKYQRGGVILQADIDVAQQKITWSVSGVTAAANANRKTALREGLKLANDADLTESSITF